MGPRTMRDLARHPELSRWPHRRLERALVHAWGDGRVTVDPTDAFVAL
ncbi:MAG: hypothetical protein ACJ72D_17845 [Marmoricola sp.]